MTIIVGLLSFTASVSSQSSNSAFSRAATEAAESAIREARDGATVGIVPAELKTERELTRTDAYRVTYQIQEISAGTNKYIKGIGRVYVPASSATPSYTKEISGALVRLNKEAANPLPFSDISAALSYSPFTCGVMSGQAYCWGLNDTGANGDGTTNPSVMPKAVEKSILGGKTVTAISAGDLHTCAIANNKAYCWGEGNIGQLGNNSTSGSYIPVAVYTGGTLNGKTVTDVGVGNSHTCAIADGAAYCWGDNWAGQIGNNTTGTSYTTPVAVYTGGALSGKTVTKLAIGQWHSCALADGTVYCWGWNADGQLGNDTTTDSGEPVAVGGLLAGKTVTDIAAGSYQTCAIADGQAYCWGYGENGELGNNTVNNYYTPTAVDTSGALAGKTVKKIDIGGWHACVSTDETAGVYCWGWNGNGQLGANNHTQSLVPILSTKPDPGSTEGDLAGKTILKLSAGYDHTCVVANDDNAYCWGGNWGGQLGNGTTSSASLPIRVYRP